MAVGQLRVQLLQLLGEYREFFGARRGLVQQALQAIVIGQRLFLRGYFLLQFFLSCQFFLARAGCLYLLLQGGDLTLAVVALFL